MVHETADADRQRRRRRLLVVLLTVALLILMAGVAGEAMFARARSGSGNSGRQAGGGAGAVGTPKPAAPPGTRRPSDLSQIKWARPAYPIVPNGEPAAPWTSWDDWKPSSCSPGTDVVPVPGRSFGPFEYDNTGSPIYAARVFAAGYCGGTDVAVSVEAAASPSGPWYGLGQFPMRGAVGSGGSWLLPEPLAGASKIWLRVQVSPEEKGGIGFLEVQTGTWTSQPST